MLVRAPGAELERIDAAAYDPAADALVDPRGAGTGWGASPPDLGRAHAQHAALVAALEAEGVTVDALAPLGDRFAKAMYIRDPLVVLPEGVLVGRMGVRMRRGEEAAVTAEAAALGAPVLATVTGDGVLEGGTVLRLAPHVWAAGTGVRCNARGFARLRDVLAWLGVELLSVPLPGWSIHLDMHMAVVGAGPRAGPLARAAVRLPRGAARARHRGARRAGRGAVGVNLLCLRPDRVLMAAGNPRTEEVLGAAGVEVVTVAYDELWKNGGGIHCSTQELVRDPSLRLSRASRASEPAHRGGATASATPAARYSAATGSGRAASVTISSSSCARAIVTSAARPYFVASTSPTVRPAFACAARSTSAIGLRAVDSPFSSVIPAADTNATSKFSRPMKSTVQRPVTARVCWSSSPGQTTRCTVSALMFAAMKGEFVTSVSSRGGASMIASASACAVDDASRKTVAPSAHARERVGGDRRLGLGLLRDPRLPRRGVGRGRAASARAPPRTRSTRPSRASCSRSRCAVMLEMAWVRARSAIVAAPRSRMCSRMRARRIAAGTALTCSRGAS